MFPSQPPRDTTKMCALCLSGDYRKCPCPWNKPFDLWPSTAVASLRSQISDGPYEGS